MPTNLIFGGITIVATKRASPVLLCELLDTADATLLNSVCEHRHDCVCHDLTETLTKNLADA